jgi:hypothetical protein
LDSKSFSIPVAAEKFLSRSRISDRRAEHVQRRYCSFLRAQNWSMHAKYASLHPAYPSPSNSVLVARAARETSAGFAVFFAGSLAETAGTPDAARAETLLLVIIADVLAALRDCVWRRAGAAGWGRETAALRAADACGWEADGRTSAPLLSAAESGMQNIIAKNG